MSSDMVAWANGHTVNASHECADDDWRAVSRSTRRTDEWWPSQADNIALSSRFSCSALATSGHSHNAARRLPAGRSAPRSPMASTQACRLACRGCSRVPASGVGHGRGHRRRPATRPSGAPAHRPSSPQPSRTASTHSAWPWNTAYWSVAVLLSSASTSTISSTTLMSWN